MIQKISVLVLAALALGLSSCSIQKRRYNKGFHIEWFQTSAKQQEKSETKVNKEEKNKEFEEVKTSELKNQRTVSFFSPNSSQISGTEVLPYITIDAQNLKESQKARKLIPAFKSGIHKKSKTADEGSRQMAKGIFFMVIGAGILWFISILAGGLLMGIGFILFLIGVSNLGKDPKPVSQPTAPPPQEDKKPEYQDVVYLKNGSIIRGMIIEQIPNVSLKIQTKDSNVFVFKMEEIEKITKELER